MRVALIGIVLLLMAPGAASGAEPSDFWSTDVGAEATALSGTALGDRLAVLRVAEGSDRYSGAYVLDDDSLVVLLTARDAEVESAVMGAGKAAQIRYVEFTQSELLAGATDLYEQWQSMAPSVMLDSVAVDTAANGLVLRVHEGGESYARSLTAMSKPGLPSVTIETVAPSTDSSCTSRDNCWGPFKAGDRIRQASPPIENCTMGFHVVHNGDASATTAGHCGYVGTSSWYHDGYGLIGVRNGALVPASGGGYARDIARISMNDANASNQIYGDNARVIGFEVPLQGISVCASLAASNTIRCGTVTSAIVTYTGSTCGCLTLGVKSSITAIGGDSGSPIWEPVQVQGQPKAMAVGLISQTDGKFVNLKEALQAWGTGWSVWLP
jgi:hypothetical protein